MTWIDDARCPVEAVVGRLGWEALGRRGVPCPACRADKRDARRLPAGLTADGMGWRCFKCGAGGSSIDYVAFALAGQGLTHLDPDRRRSIRAWFQADGGTARPKSTVLASAPGLPGRPPRSEVQALWDASGPLAPVMADGPAHDADFTSFLVRKGLAPVVQQIDGGGLARATPDANTFDWPCWWPRGWARIWRLLVRGYEPSGDLASLHARGVITLDLPNGDRLPKTVWPKSPPKQRYAAAGLLFADETALAMMRGERTQVAVVLVCEGLTSWLAAAAWSRRVGSTDHAVIGACNGSFGALRRIRWGASPPPVVALVDEDPTGDRYFAEIVAALPDKRVHRGTVGGRE